MRIQRACSGDAKVNVGGALASTPNGKVPASLKPALELCVDTATATLAVGADVASEPLGFAVGAVDEMVPAALMLVSDVNAGNSKTNKYGGPRVVGGVHDAPSTGVFG
jgi:hypothetical protein